MAPDSPPSGSHAPAREQAVSETRLWNLPNALTMLRIALVPVFGWLLLLDGGQHDPWRLAAFAVFLGAILTDKIDGDLARARGLVTDFGKIADPIADKALTGMAFVGLSLIDVLPWWVTVVVLGRDWLITAIRFVVLRYGVIAASRGGKLKTTLQAVALCGFILPIAEIAWLHALAWVVMVAAVVVTVVTGAEYVVQAVRVWSRGRRDDEPSDR